MRHGAEHVVLYGWSTGATMALRAAARSALRDRISGLVLDSPVLELGDHPARPRHGPPHPGRAAPAGRARRPGPHRSARWPRGTTADAADPARLTVPTLILHGPADTIAPWGPSRRLAARRPDLVTLHPVPDAPHGAMWNADPATYEETLRRFLTPLM